MNHDSIRNIIATLNSPLVNSWEEAGNRAFNFTLLGKSQSWEVCLWFPEQFPYCLPKAQLLTENAIGHLPHINQSGVICVEENDSLFVDYTRPSEILNEFINSLVKFFNRAVLSIYQDELLDELEGFFSLEKTVNSFYQAKQQAELLSMRATSNNEGPNATAPIPVALHDRKSFPPQNYSNVKKLSQYQILNIVHIPLETAALPPDVGESFDARYFHSIKTLISEKNWKRLYKLTQKFKPSRTFFVLLSMPRSSGERTQFLLKFSADEPSKHPIRTTSNNWEIDMFSIVHNSRSYLLERGGADVNLSNKKVAVVGCGSVGSQIASMLAKAGIGALVLVDKDDLKADNIYRHQLGGSWLSYEAGKVPASIPSFSKVSALKYQLEKDMPYLKVFPKRNNLAEILNDRDLRDCEAVVIAVGAPSLNLQINRALKNNDFSNVIICWNEAGGVGGHSVALDLQKMCYECLFTDNQGLSSESKLSLLKGGQMVSKNLTGCAGVFTPFSFLDSNKTAEIASSQTLSILLKKQACTAYSWKGENSANLQTTNRFKSMPLKEIVSLQKHPQCRVCHD